MCFFRNGFLNTDADSSEGLRVNPIGIHVFLGRSHKNTNYVFYLVNPVYGMDMYIFKLAVFIKQAQYE